MNSKFINDGTRVARDAFSMDGQRSAEIVQPVYMQRYSANTDEIAGFRCACSVPGAMRLCKQRTVNGHGLSGIFNTA